ncbi:hypothetical protein Q3G72_013521 [Acer saccharum]|nr:hypothetical protein Q3G72_013521 [Acer saccharum]
MDYGISVFLYIDSDAFTGNQRVLVNFISFHKNSKGELEYFDHVIGKPVYGSETLYVDVLQLKFGVLYIVIDREEERK